MIRVNLFDTIPKWGLVKNVFYYFKFHWDFIDYNVNVCIYCFEILILTYSDFTFDNASFGLRNRSGFK